MDGRRPGHTQLPAPTRQPTSPGRHSAQTWHPPDHDDREVLSNTSEQWFPADAFLARDDDRATHSPSPTRASHARHRAARRAPSRGGRWARQLAVLLPLALASSSWAALGDVEGHKGSWFPDGYRVALGSDHDPSTSRVEDSTPYSDEKASPSPDRSRKSPVVPGPARKPKHGSGAGDGAGHGAGQEAGGGAADGSRPDAPSKPQAPKQPAPKPASPEPAPPAPAPKPSETPSPTPPQRAGLPLPQLPLPLPLPTSLPLPLPLLTSGQADPTSLPADDPATQSLLMSLFGPDAALPQATDGAFLPLGGLLGG